MCDTQSDLQFAGNATKPGCPILNAEQREGEGWDTTIVGPLSRPIPIGLVSSGRSEECVLSLSKRPVVYRQPSMGN